MKKLLLLVLIMVAALLMSGIPVGIIAGRLKRLGILRNHSEATRIQKLRQPRFLCRLCGKKKPIDELVMNRRYSPPIPCCKKCAGY
ncbi:MAG: hypothetical protein KAV98_06000 [Dehalococcoidia bacterium]|nr:hypothetical protein [Dehalococcoidia bacterium]